MATTQSVITAVHYGSASVGVNTNTYSQDPNDHMWNGTGTTGGQKDSYNQCIQFVMPLGHPIVTSAYLEVVGYVALTTDTVWERIYIEAADNPALPSSLSDFNSRDIATHGYVDWNPEPHMAVGTAYDSPDLTALLNHFFQYQTGFQAGNNFNLFWNEYNSSAGNYYRETCSMFHATYAGPKLFITYQLPPRIFFVQ